MRACGRQGSAAPCCPQGALRAHLSDQVNLAPAALPAAPPPLTRGSCGTTATGEKGPAVNTPRGRTL